MPKHPRPPFINDLTFGRPQCTWCWDTGLCPECLGHYPQYCPADCPAGTCTCPAGQARRAAYQQSIRDFRAIGGQP